MNLTEEQRSRIEAWIRDELSKFILLQEYVRELPILLKIDFVDFGQVTEEFKNVSLQSIVPFQT